MLGRLLGVDDGRQLLELDLDRFERHRSPGKALSATTTAIRIADLMDLAERETRGA